MRFKHFFKYLKLAVALAFLGALLHFANQKALAQILLEVNLFYVTWATLVYLLVFVGQAYRLFVLLERYSISIIRTLNIFFVSLFFNSFLPGGTGGDVYKIHKLNHSEKNIEKAFATIVLERLFNVSINILIFIAYWLLFPKRAKEILDFDLMAGVYNLKASTIILILCFAALLFIVLRRSMGNIYRKISMRVKKFIQKTIVASHEFSLARLSYASLVSFLLVPLRMLSFYLLYLAVCYNETYSVGYLDMLLLISTVALISVLPVSLGALGIREGVIAYFFIQLGVIYNQAIVIAILQRLILWLVALAGGIIYLLPNVRQKSTAKALN